MGNGERGGGRVGKGSSLKLRCVKLRLTCHFSVCVWFGWVSYGVLKPQAGRVYLTHGAARTVCGAEGGEAVNRVLK